MVIVDNESGTYEAVSYLISWGPLIDPALTAVSQPSYSISTLACQTLLKKIKGVARNETPLEDILIKPKLITRESCGKDCRESAFGRG